MKSLLLAIVGTVLFFASFIGGLFCGLLVQQEDYYWRDGVQHGYEMAQEELQTGKPSPQRYLLRE